MGSVSLELINKEIWIIICYLLFINLLAFWLFFWDKRKAKRGEYRISERGLIGSALAGGSIGAFAGMLTFRHKTRKLKFIWGVPAIFAMQLIVLLYLIQR